MSDETPGREALAVIESRLRALASFCSVVFFADAEGRIVDACGAENLGVPMAPGPFRGRSLMEVLPAEAREGLRRAMAEVKVTGRRASFEFSCRGSIGDQHLEGELVATDIRELVLSIRDVTTCKEAERKLSQSEKGYRGIIESQGELVCRWTPDTCLTFVNESYCRFFGREPSEFIGRSFLELTPEREWPRIRAGAEALVQNPASACFVNEAFAPDGSIRLLEWSVAPIAVDEGRTREFLGVGRDITEQRRVEQEVRRKKQEFETLAEHHPDIISRHDRQLRYLYANKAFLTRTGLPLEALIGKTAPELGFPVQTMAEFQDVLERAFTSGNPAKTVIAVPDPAVGFFEVQAVPEAVDEGEPQTVLCISHDITELRHTQERLEESNRNLEQRIQERTEELRIVNQEMSHVLRMKDEFLASMSHELRTPLNAILGFTQALSDGVYGPLSERLLRSVKVVEDSGKHLLELISDILDLSKLQAGRLQLEHAVVPVRSLAEASLQMVAKMADRKQIRCSLEQDPGVDILVADGRRLKQMLVNLLSNAVKFTADGGSVTLSVTGDRAVRVIRFAVSDTGIGIEPEMIPRLFQPFTQVDSRLSRQHSGTGLGLSLVLNMAALHGGGVEVKSEPGKGSSFTISLPWREQVSSSDRRPRESGQYPAILRSALPATARRSNEKGPIRVLLAEDNESNAYFLGELLTARGYQLSLARNGYEAVQLTRDSGPDIVLMDIQMPGMDGLEAIRRIRAHDDVKHVPVIALTALALAGDRERCLSAGANGYVTKPVDAAKLATMIETILGTGESGS